MKVLFITFEYPPKIEGGVGTYAEHLACGLRTRGIDVYTITRGDKTCCDETTYRVLTPNTLYWQRFYFTEQAIRAARMLNKTHRFDLIHLNGTYPITRRLKLPTVSTFHAPPNVKQMMLGLKLLESPRTVNDILFLAFKNPVGSLFDIFSARVSDKIICPTPILARDLLTYCFVKEEKICVISNGVDLKRFDETESSDSSFLDKYGVQRDSYLLYMGRLSFLKGLQYLIEAFKLAQKQHPAVKLVIVGKGDFEPRLRKVARKTKGIVFTGYVDSIRAKKLLLDASLAVVIPSPLYEVAPMAILEGMVCGKPVVATNVGGNPFMIKHGKSGFLSKPRNPEDLAKYINILCEDQVLRRRMGMFGRKLVEQKFSLDKMVNKTLKLYDSISHPTVQWSKTEK